MKKKKITNHIKKWRIGDYIRQFSIVVAGIIVTFYGSSLITNHAQQKEVKSVMQFVRAELEYNRKELQQIHNKILGEQVISSYLIDCDFDTRKIPADTLLKYRRFISSSSSFEYTSDALEVLKNSSLMQQISDKKLLLDLVKTYETLRRVKISVSDLYQIKNDLLVDMSLSFSNEERKTHPKSDVYTQYEVVLNKSTGMQNFCWLAKGYFDPEFFPDTFQLLDNNIKALSEKYSSND